MKEFKNIPGINIQWPWSELIVSGQKTIETRSYPIPVKHIGKELAIIETPGPRGRIDAGIKKARIIGTVIFSSSFQYKNAKDWAKDIDKHGVSKEDTLFGFKKNKEKWGWTVESVKRFQKNVEAPAIRGIVFASKCFIKNIDQ